MVASPEKNSSSQVERTANYLFELNAALAPLTDVSAIKSTVARVLGTWLGVGRVAYLKVNGTAVEVSSDWCDGLGALSTFMPLYAISESARRAFATGGTRIIDDVEHDPRLSPDERTHYIEYGARAYMSIGFLREGRWVASYVVHSATPRQWTRMEQAIFQDTAMRVWLTVQRDASDRAVAALRQREVEASDLTMAVIQEADRRKDEFIATMGHELLGPLAPLRNGLDLARAHQSDDPLLANALNVADRQVSRLVRLVDDLFDIGRINLGRLELRKAPVGLHEILARSVESARPLIETLRHTLLIEAPSTAHLVLGDADRLVQVFTNLLVNAAKYTPDGGHIGVTLTHDAGWDVVQVQDDGIGIPPLELDRVFDLFARVPSQQDVPVDGLGIGLSISKRMVEHHGGTISASSDGPGRGSCFTVRLTAKKTESRVDDLAPIAEHAAPPRKLILVVDDHVDAAEMLSLLLQAMGHDTVVANTGSAAIQLAVTMRPDLILLDLSLPDMHGTEVARSICDQLGEERPRMAALTGWGQPEDRARTKAAGINTHFVKPLNRDALEALLASLHETSASTAGTAARAGVTWQ